MPSHFHYDHTGQVEFESLALLDLPHIRAQAVGNTITPTWGQYLGSAEGLDQPTWQVDEWIAPGSTVDLGGRELTLLFTPGHTDNSVSLHDQANNKLYSGDFIGRNGINAYYPGGNLGDYLQTAEKIVSDLSTDTQLLAAHAQDQPELPTLTITDVRTLRDQLKKIKAGELSSTGFYPVVYSITPTQKLNAEPKWLQNWQPTIATE